MGRLLGRPLDDTTPTLLERGDRQIEMGISRLFFARGLPTSELHGHSIGTFHEADVA